MFWASSQVQCSCGFSDMRLSRVQMWAALLGLIAAGLLLAWYAPQHVGDFLRALPGIVGAGQ